MPSCERVLRRGWPRRRREAVWRSAPTDPGAAVTVRAPQVVVAAGALESPAMLLRSGIGGPAVGRLPAPASVHRDARRLRRGHAGHGGARRTAGLVNEFANVEDGYGFLIEGAQYTTGLGASAVPCTTAVEHKQADGRLPLIRARSSGCVRDHGAGQVMLDPHGMAAPLYAMTRPARPGNDCARARAPDPRPCCRWRAADLRARPLDAAVAASGTTSSAFIARVQRIPPRAGGLQHVRRASDGHLPDGK